MKIMKTSAKIILSCITIVYAVIISSVNTYAQDKGFNLTAAKTYNPSTFSPAEKTFSSSVKLTVPHTIPVLDGNSGNHDCNITYRLDGVEHTINYKGGSDQAHPNSPDQIAKGKEYIFNSCTDPAIGHGDIITCDYIKLRVLNGDSYLEETVVSLYFQPVMFQNNNDTIVFNSTVQVNNMTVKNQLQIGEQSIHMQTPDNNDVGKNEIYSLDDLYIQSNALNESDDDIILVSRKDGDSNPKGNVGIGTNDPQKKLHVNGDILTEEMLYLNDEASKVFALGHNVNGYNESNIFSENDLCFQSSNSQLPPAALFDLNSREFSFYNATMDIYGDLNVYDKLNVLEDASFRGNIDISGNINFNGSLFHDGQETGLWDKNGNSIEYTAGNVGIGKRPGNKYNLDVTGTTHLHKLEVDEMDAGEMEFNGKKLFDYETGDDDLTEGQDLIYSDTYYNWRSYTIQINQDKPVKTVRVNWKKVGGQYFKCKYFIQGRTIDNRGWVGIGENENNMECCFYDPADMEELYIEHTLDQPKKLKYLVIMFHDIDCPINWDDDKAPFVELEALEAVPSGAVSDMITGNYDASFDHIDAKEGKFENLMMNGQPIIQYVKGENIADGLSVVHVPSENSTNTNDHLCSSSNQFTEWEVYELELNEPEMAKSVKVKMWGHDLPCAYHVVVYSHGRWECIGYKYLRDYCNDQTMTYTDEFEVNPSMKINKVKLVFDVSCNNCDNIDWSSITGSIEIEVYEALAGGKFEEVTASGGEFDDLYVKNAIGIGTDQYGHKTARYSLHLLHQNGKIAFGDNNKFMNPQPNGAINCMLGEYLPVNSSDNPDTDILHVHGKKGIYFTGGNYTDANDGVMGNNNGQNMILKMLPSVYGKNHVEINGYITVERVDIMDDVPQSDFVFSEDYELKPLKDVETYIKQHKHLPNIPSAEEFKSNGYSIGQMDNLLLQKVEELTLHAIEQEKKIDTQENEIKKQNNEIEKLKQENLKLVEQNKKIEELEGKIEQIETQLNTR